MYTFFVLGFIPGTTIQITFQMWLDVIAGLSVLVLFVSLHSRIASTASIPTMPLRIPLHARQLHLQAL